MNGGAGLALPLNRGLSENGPDSDKALQGGLPPGDQDLQRCSSWPQPLNPQLYIHRGIVHQTIGEADRAIPDYSDAMRLAPKERYR